MITKNLSSINIVFAVIYFLAYLRSGVFHSTAGISSIIVFNWLYLRSFEKDNYRWKVFHYISGLWMLYFAGSLIYGLLNILQSTITYGIMTNETLIFIIVNLAFCVLLLSHFVMYAVKNFKNLEN
ncbi:MAG: hypothetical protein EOO90_16810 [Pedobacter sp.]|nr:MAG: hypothetical protein EOO90_16810 [Pedobacter sp.]